MPSVRSSRRPFGHRRVWAAGCLCAAVATPVSSWAQPATPAGLTALLECRADVATYLGFRRWISQGGNGVARAGYAWRGTDLFQAEYALSHPVSVFGMQVHTIGLTDNGVLAEVSGITPERLAGHLHVEPSVDGGAIFLATRLVTANDAAKAHAGQAQVAPTDLDSLFEAKPTRPSYDAREVTQVVTNLGHAGRTLVGCNYVSSAESPNLPFPQK